MKIYIISDSLGVTGNGLVQAAVVQFPNDEFKIERYPLTRTESLLQGILKKGEREQAVIVYTFANSQLAEFAQKFCADHNMPHIDAMVNLIKTLSEVTKHEPIEEAGINHNMNSKYFDKIKAMEFAVEYDDGKDPSGFLKADIVLLGVSRTSKTPLSLYLANLGYKVANLPLVPKTRIPDEIYRVDPAKIIGLTTTPEVLNKYRRERMIAYGLDPDSNYSSMAQVRDELNNANQLYRKLGCLVINTAQKSIEETATFILESLGEGDN